MCSFVRPQQRHYDQNYSLYGTQTSPVVFCMQNNMISTRIASLYGSSALICGFVHAKQRLIWIKITSLYGSQTSPCDLCMQKQRDFSTRITKSPWVPDLTYRDLCMQNNVISIRITSLYGSQTSFVVFCMQNNVTLGPELQVSLCRRPHQWFFAFKTATLAPELQVSHVSQTFICGFVHSQDCDIIAPELHSLYGSQTFTGRFVHTKQRD